MLPRQRQAAEFDRKYVIADGDTFKKPDLSKRVEKSQISNTTKELVKGFNPE